MSDSNIVVKIPILRAPQISNVPIQFSIDGQSLREKLSIHSIAYVEKNTQHALHLVAVGWCLVSSWR